MLTAVSRDDRRCGRSELLVAIDFMFAVFGKIPSAMCSRTGCPGPVAKPCLRH